VIFVSIYIVTFGIGFLLLSAQSLSSKGERSHAGPTVALAFVSKEIFHSAGKLQIETSGHFARLAAKNPHLWLLARSGGNRLSFGPVPPSASALMDQNNGFLNEGRFHVAGVAKPYDDGQLTLRWTPAGQVLLAVGGVDPGTITFGDSFRYLLTEGFDLILGAMGLLGLIALLVALPLLTRALKPMTSDAAAISAERPGSRLRENKVPRELLPLVKGFNSALERLDQELVRRRRFIADVAHELRTPLSIISLQVESLPRTATKDNMRRVVSRLSHLAAQMLDVERLSLSGDNKTDVEVVALTRDVIADTALMVTAGGYELSLKAPSTPIITVGDPQALARAIYNLIGNAVAHGGGKGEIQVFIDERGTLDVIDEGPGVAPSVRPYLFEPFSRARWDRDGCGLGLHLTREIMRAHGGDAVLLPSNQGAAFRLRFAVSYTRPPDFGHST
jgi:signal transduction histidine kinase